MEDVYWMRRAVALAGKGVGFTSPNPPVGAVLMKNERALGEGWHQGAGQAHAEVEAIEDARSRHGETCCMGATLYVTLEPCSTRGRTGPCTEAIIKAGISRVVYGAMDPNPHHEGIADAILQEAGIAVRAGVEADACARLIRPFAKVQQTGLPWVVVKTAMSLDGRITRPPGEGQWLSGPEARQEVQVLRRQADAVLTSGQTVRCDDPSLTVRDPALHPERRQPWRVVLTSRPNGIPRDAALLTDEFAARTLVFQGKRLEIVLRELVSEHGVCCVLVEAGGRLLGRLLDEGWADEVVVYLTPMLTGGPIPSVGGEGVTEFAERLRLGEIAFARFGHDVRMRGTIAGRGGRPER